MGDLFGLQQMSISVNEYWHPLKAKRISYIRFGLSDFPQSFYAQKTYNNNNNISLHNTYNISPANKMEAMMQRHNRSNDATHNEIMEGGNRNEKRKQKWEIKEKEKSRKKRVKERFCVRVWDMLWWQWKKGKNMVRALY